MNGQYKTGDIVLGNWTLTKQVGEGAFGRVFEAERNDFGRVYKAAIKIITIPQSQSEILSVKADGMDEKSVSDYFRGFVGELIDEFSLMSELKGNSNIVSYEDHKVVAFTDGIGWDIIIRMELLTPLINYALENEFTKKDIIKLGIDMCSALELCQKLKIIHRDIKPENIFISKNGDYKLGDFGIARMVEKTTGGLSKKGTYTYMAPEVYRGEPYGSNVDLYSLGIVLYRMLNDNRIPFMPPYPIPIKHSDRENALMKRINGELLPPPKNANMHLSQIVLKASAFNPNERYLTPKQMRDDLESASYYCDESSVIHIQEDETYVKSAEYINSSSPQTDDNITVISYEQDIMTVVHDESTGNEYKQKSSDWVKRTPSKLKIGIIASVAFALVVSLVLFSGWFNTSDDAPKPDTPEIYERLGNKEENKQNDTIPEETPEFVRPLEPVLPNDNDTSVDDNVDEQPQSITIENPKIVITTRYNTQRGEFSAQDDYVRGVEIAGGVAIQPYNDTLLADILQNGSVNNAEVIAELYDGLLLTGGGDVAAHFFGQERHPASTEPDEIRDIAEIALTQAFIKPGKPILGINRGMQVLNISMGGDIIQDIPDLLGIDSSVHSGNSTHIIDVVQGSWLYDMFGSSLIAVSNHHQSVGQLADGFEIAATVGPVVEAIEQRNWLGIQFNPARLSENQMLSIYEDFIRRCSIYYAN